MAVDLPPADFLEVAGLLAADFPAEGSLGVATFVVAVEANVVVIAAAAASILAKCSREPTPTATA